MKDAHTKNGMRVDPARYGKLMINKNKMYDKAIHWLDEESSETDTTEIGSLAWYWKNLDFSQHSVVWATYLFFVLLFVFSPCCL